MTEAPSSPIRVGVVADDEAVRLALVTLCIDVIGVRASLAAGAVNELEAVAADTQLVILDPGDGVSARQRALRAAAVLPVPLLLVPDGARPALVARRPGAEALEAASGIASFVAGLASVGDSTPRLGTREREVVALVAEGLTDAEIGARLDITVSTVRSHLDRIGQKTGARRRPELVRLAYRLGITPVD